MPEFGLFRPRGNVPVAGGPPRLASWCIVDSDPTGSLVKPAGTIAYHIGGLRAWRNTDGTAAGWVDVDDRVYDIETWVPTVNSQIKDFAFNPALWEELEIVVDKANTVGHAGEQIKLRMDGAIATGPYAQTKLRYNAFAAVYGEVVLAEALASSELAIVAKVRCLRSGWLWEVRSNLNVFNGGTSQQAWFITPPAVVSVGVQSASADGFAANVATVTFRGKKKV